MKKLLFYILIILSAFQLNAQTCTALLADEEIKIGEQTNLEIEVRFSSGASNVIFPALQDTISKFIQIVDIASIDTVFDEEDVSRKIFHQKITITSWDSGFHVIPPFLFEVDGQTVKTEPLMLHVLPVDLAPDQDIKDIKEILEVPFSLTDWLIVHRYKFLIALLALGLLFIVWKYYQKFRNKEIIIEDAPKEAADIIALRELDQLIADQLIEKGQVKMYYLRLSHIMRKYMENRFSVPALESSSNEIIDLIELHSGIKNEELKILIDHIMLSDLAKFAKYNPSQEENKKSVSVVRQFIESTSLKIESEESDNLETGEA